MKIINLQAENIKKLVAVSITPDGNLVQITGANGNGKTSVLDAIWWALAGVSNIQEKPIREGQTQARIRLDLGEAIVTRTFRLKDGGEYTSQINVENAEGVKFPSPQTMLDDLLGQLSFDPLAFARMEPKAQFNALRRFVPDVDFDGIESANKADYEKRKDLNRRAKEAKTLAQSVEIPADLPTAPIDENGLIDELQKANEHNALIETKKNNRNSLRQNTDAKKKEVAVLVEELVRLQDKINAMNAEIKKNEEKLAAAGPLPEPKDITEIRKKIDGAKELNSKIAAREEKHQHLELAKQYQADADALTEAMERREQEKLERIAQANIPVAGMTFGDGEILMKGVPFNQASDAEQLRASIAIAMALNPKLRVIRVRDGSLLDSKSLKVLEEMAEKKDYQVWIERVDDSGKVGFVLEDGHLKNNNMKEGDGE